MTTASGISVSSELEAAFGKAREQGNVRFLEVDIVDESLQCVGQQNVQGTLEQDWSSKVIESFRPKEPRIFLVRSDEKNELGWQWVFVSYVPDGSAVRKRMLFASSRDTCKKQLGSSYFSSDVSGSSADELQWDQFFERLKAAKTPSKIDVLSETERALQREAVAEVDMGGSNAHAVRFPTAAEATQAIAAFKDGQNNLVCFKLNVAEEKIELNHAASVEIAALEEQFNDTEPRFYLVQYPHEHEGEKRVDCVCFFVF